MKRHSKSQTQLFHTEGSSYVLVAWLALHITPRMLLTQLYFGQNQKVSRTAAVTKQNIPNVGAGNFRFQTSCKQLKKKNWELMCSTPPVCLLRKVNHFRPTVQWFLQTRAVIDPNRPTQESQMPANQQNFHSWFAIHLGKSKKKKQHEIRR